MNANDALELATSFWEAHGWDPEWIAPSIQDLADHFTTEKPQEATS